MTPRELAEKAEMEALIDYLGRRAFQHAGDAAEMKAAFEQAVAEIAALKAPPGKPAEPVLGVLGNVAGMNQRMFTNYNAYPDLTPNLGVGEAIPPGWPAK